MHPRRILFFAAIFAALISLLSLILPHGVARIYTGVMHPLTLFFGSFFAFRVATIYQKELRRSFLFLAFFLILYMVGNILVLWQFLYSLLGDNINFIVLILQVVDYAMLITSCIYTLKVIEVKRMNRYGWVFLGLLLPLCLYIVTYGLPAMLSAFDVSPALAVSGMMIRVFDMSILLMLAPVFSLYLQHLKSKAQESLTFTFIMGGLIFSLISTYIFQLVVRMPSEAIAAEYFQKGSILDAAYIFGYLLVAIGLYAHRKYDDWGFRLIEKALG